MTKKTRSVGRPFIEITEKMIEDMKVLSGQGLTQRQIAAYFGMSYTTLCERMKDNEAIRLAYHQGKAKTISFVAGQLIQQIKNGSTSATIFYLKTQAGWVDPNASGNNTPPPEDYDHDEDNESRKLRIDTNDPNEAAKVYQQIMLGDNK